MRAAVLRELPARSLPVAEVEEPRTAPGELLVEVAACGICGTDTHVLEGHSYRPDLPFVMGHEPVGRVVATGSAQDSGWIGRRITMTLFEGDGTCAECRRGDQRLCPALRSIVGIMGRGGGFAERLVVPAGQAVPVPDALDDATVATLVDAGATAANAVRLAEAVERRLTVIVGGGPIGVLCAEMLAANDGEVVVVQTSAARRETLRAMGHRVVAAVGEVQGTPEVVIDAAGAPEVLPWALGALGPHGLFVAAGYGPIDRLDVAPMARKEIVLRGVRSGRREDLERILRLVAEGAVRVPPISRWPLARIDDALEALRARRVPGKAVIDVAG